MLNGFRNFVFRGNLVDLAVAVIIGAAFGTVVTTFTAWLTSQLPSSLDDVFTNRENSFGAFMNAVISFLILAAVVYFLIVVPYVKAKERFFPSPAPGTPEDITLLRDIRDILQSSAAGGSTGGGHAAPPSGLDKA
ncbi:large-conductance mechanosensitive channel protein MscL [Nocardioides marinquilinus]|uniref:Large-conductance mechanosensitive channel protein MscL n=1 Tax=Nocardioides marinquilinus TaxID=1210400 RepID=A0ABP9PEY4_9ACTN